MRIQRENLQGSRAWTWNHLAQEMFNAGSNLKGKSAEEICFLDFKQFTVNDTVFGVGQVNSMSADELKEIRKTVQPHLEKARSNHGLDMIFFMLTNNHHRVLRAALLRTGGEREDPQCVRSAGGHGDDHAQGRGIQEEAARAYTGRRAAAVRRQRMAKQTWKPGNMIYPLPAVMVSTADKERNSNILTVAWTGNRVHESSYGVYIRPAGAIFLSHDKRERRVRY